MNWRDDEAYNANWCPDCGLPREVCTCDLEGVGDWYEDAPDDVEDLPLDDDAFIEVDLPDDPSQ